MGGFIMVPDWAARGVLHPREFAIYAAMLSRADAKTGECFPMYETLAAESGVTRRQVPYALAELMDEGLIRKRRGRSFNRYTVLRFADDRPEGYRSRFERGDRLAVRHRVRETHSHDVDESDRVRETHSAECAKRTSQSARDALEPDPLEPDPDEPSRVHRDATHDDADDVSAIESHDTPSAGVVEIGRTDAQVSLLVDLHIFATRRVPSARTIERFHGLTNDECTDAISTYWRQIDAHGRGPAYDGPEPGAPTYERLSARGRQWADVALVPAEMSQ